MRISFVTFVATLAGALSFPSLLPCGDQTFTIPAGTNLQVQLTTTLSTKTSQNGDPWTGKVVEPVFAAGQEIIPEGSWVEGHITFVKPPGRAKGVAEMRLILDSITTSDGVQYSASAGLEDVQGAEGARVGGEEGTIKGPSSKKSDAKTVGVGAGAGAAVGAITAGGKGSLYGAGIGAGAALIRGLLKRGKEIVLPQGTELTFIIARDTPGKKSASASDSSPK